MTLFQPLLNIAKHGKDGLIYMQPFIVQGDKTSHGGTVLAGSLFSDCDGKPVARVGDMVACPKCRGVFPIAEGDQSNTLNAPQRIAYARIAGDRNKVLKLEPGQCDCDSKEQQESKIPVEELGFAAAAAGWIAFVLSRGKIRPPIRNPPLAPAF